MARARFAAFPWVTWMDRVACVAVGAGVSCEAKVRLPCAVIVSGSLTL
jgi:hypothetical protein